MCLYGNIFSCTYEMLRLKIDVFPLSRHLTTIGVWGKNFVWQVKFDTNEKFHAIYIAGTANEVQNG